jgi:hypothetical protein
MGFVEGLGCCAGNRRKHWFSLQGAAGDSEKNLRLATVLSHSKVAVPHVREPFQRFNAQTAFNVPSTLQRHSTLQRLRVSSTASWPCGPDENNSTSSRRKARLKGKTT